MAWNDILPIVLAIIAATPGIVALFKGRSKEKADAAKIITESARDLLGEYRVKVDELEEEYLAKIAAIENTVAQQAEKIQVQGRLIAQQAEEIDSQRLELGQQEARINVLEKERDEIMEGVQALCTQIRNLGHAPVWEPRKKI
jgi:beta-phosphoglucomutase-like phosphatase (HAD superfamily)